MKCLVIGYGSIGQRHARVLQEMGHDVALVSRSTTPEFLVFRSISEGVETWEPQYVVIANDTKIHAASLSELAKLKYEGITLVEKPLAAQIEELGAVPSGSVYVGYTLRFHPIIQRLVKHLRDEQLWTLTAYVGQFLPDWRPDSDYRKSYSARKEDGGVIRDLSHELDYVQLCAGTCRQTIVSGGQLSSLEIESEDAATLLAKLDRCPLATVHVNYLDRSPSRWIIANGSMGTIHVDLIKGVFSINGKEELVPVVRDSMIRDQHLAAMHQETSMLCTLEDAMATMRWIEAAHESLRTTHWVTVES
ncbi:Gfo/Idh/MocA family oxidoreductase [Halodesulfovibrio sp.]|jgi:predicted dehydrogenase|uniref:Gfo/Idh/MocA family protein n=1 Tax=Halodesulfovibrio sp. TaxID=1912772 RepID=UPI0025E40034|nr:Gfo/Idh/MocA family oxidoreductase [Halodesulfovibrio sp.]MCT4626532.1 hypothetical protein [Halodesulfovibrio sp.]